MDVMSIVLFYDYTLQHDYHIHFIEPRTSDISSEMLNSYFSAR